MLDIELLRSNPEVAKRGIVAKGMGDPGLVDEVLSLDTDWRTLSTELQKLKTELNEKGREIGALMRDGRREEAQALVKRNGEIKERSAAAEAELKVVADKRARLLLELPNIPHESVPEGATPDDNVVHSTWGDSGASPDARPHWETVEELEIVDFMRGAKVTGAGFPFYVGDGARLQRALISWFLDRAGQAGYAEIQAPLFVNEDSATATGQLPDKEDQMYEMKRDGLFAIPTAEVPVTNFLRDEMLDAESLPLRFCGYTPCFRREAGSYGKDVRGLNRLHQFDKVEIVRFERPDRSYEALEEMTEHSESLLRDLGLPFRRLLMCAGDMGFTQAKKYDLEVWSPGQERWLEVSSISNFEAFQSRRARIRFRESGGKPQFVHTLNGSALALPRIVAALIETYYDPDGSIRLPEVLKPYLGVDRLVGR